MNNMTPKLSIIIPCYNCEGTLREAVDSCYTQGFTDIEFEIVMVDDGSQDGTWSLMQRLSNEHTNIHISQHEHNNGGGATRNTATRKARSNLIFCLDSDDILPPNTLDKMCALQAKTGADGIGVETSIKFGGSDIENIIFKNTFSYAGKKIPLTALLERDGIMCSLYSTLFIHKRSF